MRILKVDPKKKIQALRNNPYFNDLDEVILQQISVHMRLRAFERGEALFWEGEPCAGLHIIDQGSVKLFRLSPQGRQYIVRNLHEGDTCNEVSVFDNGTNPVNVEALEGTTAWVINPQVLRDLVNSHPAFALKVINNFSGNLRNLVRMVSEMAFFQVTHRLARLISQMNPDELNGKSGARLTQDQIAARLGTVREVVARSLRELERSGAIQVKNRRIQVVAPDVLEQWAQPFN